MRIIGLPALFLACTPALAQTPPLYSGQTAVTLQRGAGNSASILQGGAGNTAVIAQIGPDNSREVVQTGTNQTYGSLQAPLAGGAEAYARTGGTKGAPVVLHFDLE